MAFLTNVLLVACLGLMPDGHTPSPVIVPDGGTVRLGGVKTKSVVQITVAVPDGGTILLGGLKRLPGSVVQLAVVVPDGGTVLLGGLKRLR